MALKALYCDVRQLLAYIKDVHGGIFRRVLLSGLLDSAARPQQPQDSPPENSGGYFKLKFFSFNNIISFYYKVVFFFVFFCRDCLQSTGDDCGGVPPATFFVVDETTAEKNRKGKKNTRYLTWQFLSLKAYRFSVGGGRNTILWIEY